MLITRIMKRYINFFLLLISIIFFSKNEIKSYNQEDHADYNYEDHLMNDHKPVINYHLNDNLINAYPESNKDDKSIINDKIEEKSLSPQSRDIQEQEMEPPHFQPSREKDDDDKFTSPINQQDHQFYNPTPLYNNLIDKEDKKIILDPNQNIDSVDEFQIQDSYPIHNQSNFNQSKESLKLNSEKDIYWEFGPNGQYIDLIIRKKTNIESIMLTNMYYGKKYIESYGNKVYGLRAKVPFKVNINEKRIINNKMISNSKGIYFLTDSSAEDNYSFKKAFRIRLPLQVEYGYKAPKENYGVIFIRKGVVLNLRTFSKAYANHQYPFENNPIEIDFSEKDYLKRMKPNLEKLAVFHSNGFKIIKVKYFSRFDYIKYFLLRDIHKSTYFKKISFSQEPFKNESALTIRAMNNPESGITIIALIYIKEENYEKDYEISAVDQQNRFSMNIINFTNTPSLDKIYKNFKENHSKSQKELIQNFSTNEKNLRYDHKE